jgi:hypothetical protein
MKDDPNRIKANKPEIILDLGIRLDMVSEPKVKQKNRKAGSQNKQAEERISMDIKL